MSFNSKPSRMLSISSRCVPPELGGGIVTKLLPAFVGSPFLDAFTAKEPHRALMMRMPVWVLLNPKTSQLGAAHAALDLL